MKGREFEIYLEHEHRLKPLCRFKARPKTMNALLTPNRGINENIYRNIYRYITGEEAKPGQSAKEFAGFIDKPGRRLDVSIVLQTYRRMLQLGAHHIDALIEAYDFFFTTAPERVTDFTFERAMILARAFEGGEIALKKCSSCSACYVNEKDAPATCAVCHNGKFGGVRKRVRSRSIPTYKNA